MTLDDIVASGVYGTLVAEEATYVDASGESVALRVIPAQEPATFLGEASRPVTSTRRWFALRKSSLDHRPQSGEVVVHAGTRYCVDGKAEDISPEEWLIYAVA